MKILKFETSHCPMCKAMDNMLKSMGVEFERIDAESDEGMTQVEYFGIKNVPTLIKLNDDGYEVGRIGFANYSTIENFLEGD